MPTKYASAKNSIAQCDRCGFRYKLKERNIPHYFVLHYHDEVAVVTKDEYAEEVAELSIEAFTEAPKWFGIECMGGDAHIGKDYSQVH